MHSPLRFWARGGALLNWIKPSKNKEIASLLSEVRGSHIKLREIDLSCIQFSPSQIICRGEAFLAYKGVLPSGQQVTVKRYRSLWSLDDFKNEITFDFQSESAHIMNQLGYCIHEDGEVILVSDYASEGDLFNHLHNPGSSPLTWKQRLQICIDAAEGLDYLHTGSNNPIIHSDVKSANILLDGKLVAKLFDFSWSRAEPTGETDAYVSTLVKGTLGYLDPEYFRRSHLTYKSDVYSFGVVLFEVLCGRHPWSDTDSCWLATLAPLCFKEGTLADIIDPNIKGQIAPECLTTFSETANACLCTATTDRPEVVWTLEFAMQRQLAAEERHRW